MMIPLRLFVLAVLSAPLCGCVAPSDNVFGAPPARTEPVLPHLYPTYDPLADNPPYPYYNHDRLPQRREPAERGDYYRNDAPPLPRIYPRYDPEADNPSHYYNYPRRPPPQDGFVRPMFER